MAKIGLIFLFLMMPFVASAAELVLFETPACAWCIRWHRDVGQGYDRTRAARLMPLRRVDILRPVPAELAALGVGAVPTFVVTECGREVGRLVGYSGTADFWSGLEEIARRLTGECRG